MLADCRNVLVVEDDIDIRSMLELTLKAEGYRVRTASEGHEALVRVAQEMPGLIILDLKMPGMNGWEFAEEFHHRYGRSCSPIVVLTAAQAASRYAEEIGAESYLNKPFETNDLIQLVERLLRLPSGTAPTPSPTGTNAEHAIIVQRAIAGDELAFQRLYGQYAPGIYRYLYYRLGNSHDAEDLAQQVFVQAWAKLGSYRQGSSPFSSWLFTIARNLLVSFYRRRHFSTSLDDPAFRMELSDGKAAIDPVQAIELQWQHGAMKEALDGLPPIYRKVLVMRFVQDLPHREVAVALNKAEGSVRVLQLRALRKLHRLLRESGYTSL